MAEIGGYDASLRAELCAYYEWGLSVLIGEQVYHPEDITQVCKVLEEDNYTRDYVEGGQGQVASVNFTRIRN